MKVYTFNDTFDLKYWSSDTRLRSPAFVEGLISKYGRDSEENYHEHFRRHLLTRLRVGIFPLLVLTEGNLAGKRILDLGCGSTGGTYESEKLDMEHFEPWFSRALHEFGAHPVGIDAGDLSNEVFEHYSVANLQEENSLGFLEGNSFDGAIAYMLYNSPHLKMRIKGGDRTKLRNNLHSQLGRILKPDGFFIEN